MNRSPANLTALGRSGPPKRIVVHGRDFTLCRIFKNDFFAVTALYENAREKVILKIQRQAHFLLPLRWLGRLLAAREAAALTRLADLPGVPRLIDRWGDTGIVRAYIEGQPLAKGRPVPDDFHDRLRTLIDTIHERRMAYVDLEKCENVLVGDDGQPHLFDFQICWFVGARWGGELWPARMLRAWLQAGDRYHLIKLRRRTRPDQLTPEELAASYRRPWFVRFYTKFTRPLTWCRRTLLDRIGPRRGRGERGRIEPDTEPAELM